MTFKELNLSAPLLRAVQEAGYETPSPIQAAAIPPVLAGRDLMGCAQTGTGKTAAFLLPTMNNLEHIAPPKPVRERGGRNRRRGAKKPEGNGRGPVMLVITPTRELAQQIDEVASKIADVTGHVAVTVVGGVSYKPQTAALKYGCDILVATPGRLVDLIEQGACHLDEVKVLVLDEADRMLDMGFLPAVRRIVRETPAERQTLLFSATLDEEAVGEITDLVSDPARVEIAPATSTADTVDQFVFPVSIEAKNNLLPEFLKKEGPERTIVFMRTKHRADSCCRRLERKGIKAAAIHGNRSQAQRERALSAFRDGTVDVLVATDVLARGIDISDVRYVVNFDVPAEPTDYIHRIGRTARAGADGTAVSFCAPEEKEYLAGIEKLNRRQIPVVSGHPWDGVPAPVKAAPPVRGKKPKAEAEQPEKPVKAEKPAKAEKAAKAEKPAAPKKEKAAAKQPSPKNTEPKEGTSMEENQKRTSGGRSENRRSNNSRTRREGNAPQPANRGSNAQPKFDPHFVSAPEATPLRPVKKAPAAQPAAKQTAPAQNGQRQRGGQPARAEQRTDRNDPRTEQRAERNSRNARPAQNSQSQQGSRNNRNEAQSSRPARPAKSEAPRGRSRNAAPARDEDPGLMLISRRPPQQKFTNFEEYMTAHGGATAPIEDHTDET